MLFCRTYRLDWNCRESLDGVVTALLNHQFLDGKCADLRLQPSAALSHVYPGLARRSGLYLPRPCRAAAAWERRAPGRSRLPFPKTGAAAIAGMMLCLGRRLMAIYTMLTFIRYLRPLERIALLRKQRAAPVLTAGVSYASWGTLLHDLELGRPAQPGASDDAVLIDQESWTLPVLAGLQAATPPGRPPQPGAREGSRPVGVVVGPPPARQGVSPAARVAGGAQRRVQFVMSHFAALGEQGVTGPPFDQVPASVRSPLRTGQSAGVTSSAGRRRKTPTACLT